MILPFFRVSAHRELRHQCSQHRRTIHRSRRQLDPYVVAMHAVESQLGSQIDLVRPEIAMQLLEAHSLGSSDGIQVGAGESEVEAQAALSRRKLA